MTGHPAGAGRWNGLVADIRRAATARGRRQLGCYAVEGFRVHERALRAGASITKVLISEAFGEDPSPRVRRLIEQLERAGSEIHVAPDPVLDRLTEGRSIGAIVGLVPLPEERTTLAALVDEMSKPVRLLVGVDIEDPGNVGALVRTALASGSAAFVRVGLGDPYHPRAVRTSMGSVVKLPILHYRSPSGLLEDLGACGATTIGTVTRGGTPLDRIGAAGSVVAVFVGSEAFGLSEALIARLDERVTIPMASTVDSFSVNAAAAIVLYEIRRGVACGSSDG